MKYLRIEALYPKPKTTTANKEHYKYPFWSTDITYIKLEKGFVYLAAIIDWHSKKILSWRLSNIDQGSQYTSKAHVNIFTVVVIFQNHQISIA